jgi:hypothetical protein
VLQAVFDHALPTALASHLATGAPIAKYHTTHPLSKQMLRGLQKQEVPPAQAACAAAAATARQENLLLLLNLLNAGGSLLLPCLYVLNNKVRCGGAGRGGGGPLATWRAAAGACA